MDAVLGLSVTPSAVGLVLVEGQDADGATVDREAFEIPRRRRSTPLETSEQAAAAVLRTEAIAATRGHRLHSIGVTWSDDADTEASLLLESLTDHGFDNVVPVRLPEATEALAWGVAEVIGEDITAVCVVEPDTVMALIVHTGEGAVQTAVNHAIDSEDALVRWLRTVFARADWVPQALVVVGSGGAVDALMPRLEAVLSVPVFAPAEAELALARGAALASAHSNDLIFADDVRLRAERSSTSARWPTGRAGPLAMLVAGAMTFVVSVSVAVSLEMMPRNDTPPPVPRPAAKSSLEAAAAAGSVPLAPPRPALSAPAAAETPQAPPPEAPVEAAPPPAEPPIEPSAGNVGLSGAPDGVPVGGLPPEAAPAPAVSGAPVEAVPPPVPAERPGLRQRIRDRLAGINRTDDVQAVQQAPVPAAPLPAPPEAPAPQPALVAPPPEAPAPPPVEAAPSPAPEAPPPPPEAVSVPTSEPPVPPEAAPLPPPS